MDNFGARLKVSTFGESHGIGIGAVIEGFPAGIKIDSGFIASEIARRKGGQTKFSTPRKESDSVEILSGVFNGTSTGTPIGLFVKNDNTKSSDYENIKDIFRPGHADFTYFNKYGIRDYRGGGRSSARESVVRVAAGAFAKLLLNEFGVYTQSGIYSIGGINAESIDFNYAKTSEIFALDSKLESKQKQAILDAKNSHDSIGGVALIKAYGNKKVLKGLGEPLYYKLDSAIGSMMLGLNGVKAVEIGNGCEASKKLGSENNDCMSKNGFVSNNAGGILGGIATGEDILIKVHFKPTPSIFKPQNTLDSSGNETLLELKGRHDPCIAVRGSVVCESMLALILADMLLLNTTSKIENLKKIYE